MSGYGEKRYEEFRVGDRATFAKTISEADILLFAAVSGDQYPLHVDAEYARTTRFGQRAAHGMLSASLLSTVIGLLLQTPGGINVEQRIRYRKPVFIGDTLTAQVEVRRAAAGAPPPALQRDGDQPARRNGDRRRGPRAEGRALRPLIGPARDVSSPPLSCGR